MTNILVTGGKGQLGTSLRDIAESVEGCKFVFVDIDELDITDYGQVADFFRTEKFSYCINCAAYTAVDKAEQEVDLCYRINADGPLNLAKACREIGCILIHVSTDFVFSGNSNTPYKETDSPGPLNVYGASKLKGELGVQENLKEHFIVRTSWVYSEHGRNFVKTMLDLAKVRKELKLVSDQIGSPTYARDLASFLLLLIESKSGAYGIYHYSNKGSISWYDFAIEIFDYTQKKVVVIPVTSEEFKSAAQRPKRSSLSLTKTVATFPITIPSWKESLHICLARLR